MEIEQWLHRLGVGPQTWQQARFLATRLAIISRLPFVRYGFTREVNAFSGLGEDAPLSSRFGFAPFAARLAETCFRTCAKDSLGCDKRRRRDSSGLNGFIQLQNAVPRLIGKRVPICRHSLPKTLTKGILNHLSP